MDRITAKEILLGIMAVIIVISISLFLNPLIKDGLLQEVKTYQQALKIESDYDLFDHAAKTEVGNVMVYSEFSVVDKQTIPELTGTYSIIQRVTERYTRHTRQVCNTRDDDGLCTSYRTEAYYTWDTYRREYYTGQTYIFLGYEFGYNQLDLDTWDGVYLDGNTVTSGYTNRIARNTFIYEKVKIFSSVGDIRWYYKVLPERFNATLFIRIYNGGYSNPLNPQAKLSVHYRQTIDQVITTQIQKLRSFDTIFYSAITIITVILYGALAYQNDLAV